MLACHSRHDISDGEIRPQSPSGSSEIKSLIDGRQDEKGFLVSKRPMALWLEEWGHVRAKAIQAISGISWVCTCLLVRRSLGDKLFSSNVMQHYNINHCSAPLVGEGKRHLMRDVCVSGGVSPESNGETNHFVSISQRRARIKTSKLLSKHCMSKSNCFYFLLLSCLVFLGNFNIMSPFFNPSQSLFYPWTRCGVIYSVWFTVSAELRWQKPLPCHHRHTIPCETAHAWSATKKSAIDTELIECTMKWIFTLLPCPGAL